ncbi:VOC family protein [Nocardia gipuzkoensis]
MPIHGWTPRTSRARHRAFHRFRGSTALTYVVRSEARVDEILNEAEKAGATVLKPAAATQWGGYGGTFADPDGYIWSIGYSAQAADQPYAE